MKRVQLVKTIEALECELVRHGGKHDWYRDSTTHVTQPVPRHREMKDQLAAYHDRDTEQSRAHHRPRVAAQPRLSLNTPTQPSVKWRKRSSLIGILPTGNMPWMNLNFSIRTITICSTFGLNATDLGDPVAARTSSRHVTLARWSRARSANRCAGTARDQRARHASPGRPNGRQLSCHDPRGLTTELVRHAMNSASHARGSLAMNAIRNRCSCWLRPCWLHRRSPSGSPHCAKCRWRRCSSRY